MSATTDPTATRGPAASPAPVPPVVVPLVASFRSVSTRTPFPEGANSKASPTSLHPKEARTLLAATEAAERAAAAKHLLPSSGFLAKPLGKTDLRFDSSSEVLDNETQSASRPPLPPLHPPSPASALTTGVQVLIGTGNVTRELVYKSSGEDMFEASREREHSW